MKGDEELILAKVLEADELLNYQAGVIMNRELISKKTGTVTLFAFAKVKD